MSTPSNFILILLLKTREKRKKKSNSGSGFSYPAPMESDESDRDSVAAASVRQPGDPVCLNGRITNLVISMANFSGNKNIKGYQSHMMMWPNMAH